MAQTFIGGVTPTDVLRTVQAGLATIPNYSAAMSTGTGGGAPTALGGVGTGAEPLGATSGIGMFGGGPGGLEQLTQFVNRINQQAQQQANVGRIPGAAGLEAQSSENIGAALRGELPTDVLNLIGQQAAERGIATGAPGGPNANAALLRALGLTSLGQQQVGQQNLSAAYARNPAAPLFNPATQLLSPYQTATLLRTGGAGTTVGTGAGMAPFPTLPGGGGGGGYTITGGGGGAPPAMLTSPDYTQTVVGMGPSWADLFGYGGEAAPTVPMTNLEGGASFGPLPEGYQPTSGGTMYMGPEEGYNPELDAWLASEGYSPTGEPIG